MGLSDDQKALLRLLAQREEGYEDIAALKGKSVDEVRAEVRDALAELAASAEPPPPEPPPAPAEPEPAQTKQPRPAAAAEPEAPPRKLAATPRPASLAERRRVAILAGGALGIVAVVLIAIAVLGGDSDSGSGSPAAGGAGGAGTQTAAAEEGNVTQAVLTAAGGSDASGRAVFGRVGEEEIALQVTAEGLEPTGKGQSYTVWLYRTPKLSLRVGSAPVGEAGRLGARFAIPPELLAYVASGAFDQIYVSRTSNAAYKREVARAKRNDGLPRYTGETVLNGKITGPVVKGE